jgi:hypothetical protein
MMAACDNDMQAIAMGGVSLSLPPPPHPLIRMKNIYLLGAHIRILQVGLGLTAQFIGKAKPTPFYCKSPWNKFQSYPAGCGLQSHTKTLAS